MWLSKMMCTGQEKTLLDCPHSGWGENSCDHSRDAGVSCLQQGLPQILEVGCYQDKSDDRALNKLYANLRSQIDWWNMRSMVTKCAERAFVRGYKYFGVQFYGECWGDDRLRPSYDKHGPGKGCTDGELGSGRPGGAQPRGLSLSPFCTHTIFDRKGPLSYTFYCQMVLLSHTYFRTLYLFILL